MLDRLRSGAVATVVSGLADVGKTALAVEAARRLGDREREAFALNDLAIVYRDAGLLDEALEACEECLAIVRQRADHAAEATTLVNLGSVPRRLGRGEEAIAVLRRAAADFAGLGDPETAGIALHNLAVALLDAGRPVEAGSPSSGRPSTRSWRGRWPKNSGSPGGLRSTSARGQGSSPVRSSPPCWPAVPRRCRSSWRLWC
ncbi:tetratricopeptide repeat protein [Thermoactinospora rubra]|uniref:tetratricopeptide repeat protein n=1 Tax=Thermoactinospora rubra TaxID=1088767 RepID=UPI001301EF72|nr:tetratricopeptide repeat protein [Thermoactinospora rubra]